MTDEFLVRQLLTLGMFQDFPGFYLAGTLGPAVALRRGRRLAGTHEAICYDPRLAFGRS
jgi:hypothetical protein